MPMTAVIACFYLGESLGVGFLVGSLLVFAGVALNSMGAAEASMGVDAGDFDGDTVMDLLTGANGWAGGLGAGFSAGFSIGGFGAGFSAGFSTGGFGAGGCGAS